MRTEIYRNKEEWLGARKGGIGGSDAPVILGLSRFKSPLMLYAEKLGLVEPQPENESMKWGKIIQPLLIAEYASETGREVRPSENEIWWGDPPFHFSPDGIAKDGEKGEGIVEAKMTSVQFKDDWRDEPPLEPQVQVQHGLMVMGLQWGAIAVLIGGNQFFRTPDLPRNENFILLLKDKETEFARRLELKDPPPADATESTKEALKILYPKDTGETVVLGGESIELYALREDARARENQAKRDYEFATNNLKALIGDALFGVMPDGTRLRLATVNRKGYTVEPKEFRELRRLKQ